MHILEIDITNTRKLKCFKLKLDGKNMEVAGDTGAGKTTAVSALWEIMEKGKDQLTHGEKKGVIQVTIGDGEKTIIAKRVNTKTSSSIKLTDAKGKAVSVKDFKEMISALSVNPHKIKDMKPKEQVATLLKAAKLEGIDLDEVDAQIAYHEELRLVAHRKAEAIKPGEEPEKVETISASDLREKIQKAEEYNKKVKEAFALLDSLQSQKAEVEEEIETLEARLADLRNTKASLEERISNGEEVCSKLETKDVSVLWEQYEQIEERNKKALEYEAWQKRNEEYQRYLAEKQEHDQVVKDLREKKKEALDKAEWPIPGLSIEDGEIRYKGALLENLGESEQMLVCAALAMEDIKAHPLKVVRMDGVESMSKKDFETLKALFNSNDIQVLSTRVAREQVDEGEIEIVEGVYEERD